jgi:hypothetical protein
LNSNLSWIQIDLSWFEKEKEGNREVGQSFLLLSVISFFSQSFPQPLLSQSFPQPDPTCRQPFSLFFFFLVPDLPCSSSAVPAAPSLPVAPLRPLCARSRPTDQARRRPHLLEAEPQSPGVRKSVAKSAFTAGSAARTHRATPPPLKHQAASPVTSLNRDRNPSHAQLALTIEFRHDRHCR